VLNAIKANKHKKREWTPRSVKPAAQSRQQEGEEQAGKLWQEATV